MAAFWDVTPWSLLDTYQHSGGIYFLHPEDGGSRFSETLLFIYQNTQRHMPLNRNLHIHRCETLKSQTTLFSNKRNHSTRFHVHLPIPLHYILRLVTFICLFASLCQPHRPIDTERKHNTKQTWWSGAINLHYNAEWDSESQPKRSYCTSYFRQRAEWVDDDFKWLLNLIVVVSQRDMGGYKCKMWHTKATFPWH